MIWGEEENDIGGSVPKISSQRGHLGVNSGDTKTTTAFFAAVFLTFYENSNNVGRARRTLCHPSVPSYQLAFDMAFTLAQPAHSKIDIKKSSFIGFVSAIAGRPEALAEVARLRAEHPDAAHVCWALLAGGHSGASDDGEPGGTAGLPMLNVLRHQDLEQVLAVVVRYYGGIRLGAGGLVRAYTDAVAQALLGAEKIELVVTTTLCAAVPYALEGTLRRLLQQSGATLGDVVHGDVVNLSFSLPLAAADALRRDANEACHGALTWLEDNSA